ncbi:MAG: hypothetical protein KatS3mg027_2116 [Bacteroidia bacterium]|nr:MAG: hypothetical protein KatS3mg027_2116 [Bacteroidia bacterium]
MSEFSLQIKDLSVDDRPREKLLKHGASALSDAELLAIIIGSGTKGNSAIQLAQKLLSYYNNDLNKIAIQHPLSLKDTQRGLGEVRCINIIAALELGKRRYIRQFVNEETKLNDVSAAAKFFMRYLSDKVQEEFWIVVLNNALLPIDAYQITKGNIDRTLVDVRLICKYALLNNSTKVMVAHNHPSGNLMPSEEDKVITKRIKDALKLLDIDLLDHLIIFQDKYYSFADNNLL